MTQTTNQRVSKYWRSLDELENSPEFLEFVHREFPQAASELPEGISRRRWMQLMGASFTLASVAGCRWQTEEFAAFSDRPVDYVPGSHSKFATSINLAGKPHHLLVTCYDGRPIKVEGNPEHPGSAGAADGFAQATTLSLYDPDRQSALLENDGRSRKTRTWADFEAYARELVQRLVEKSGDGLAVLMPPSDSLSVAAGLKGLLDQLPQGKLFQYTPLSRVNELAGAEMAFGKPVRTRYKLADADVIACFDADLLHSFPESGIMAREYASRREPNKQENPAGMNRLYAVESSFSSTGTAADHRLATKSSSIPALLTELRDAIAAQLAGNSITAPSVSESGEPAEYSAAFAHALAEDLAGAKGKSVVVVGPQQAAESHAIAHEINALLANVGETVLYVDEPAPVVEAGSLPDLLGEIAAKRVDTLLVLGGNPLYDGPADLDIVGELGKVANTIHLSEYDNETSRQCRWSLPEAHPFESWGDTPAWDGTLGVSQPLIEPLLNGRSVIEVLALMAEGPGADGQALVRQALTEKLGGLDDKAWKKLLHDGFVPSEAPPASATLIRTGIEPPPADDESSLELVFTASSQTYDGRFANNGWLQEAPDAITKLTWDNVALVSPATAKQVGVSQGELLNLIVTDEEGTARQLAAPAFILPGQADNSIALALGYGRTAAGRVGGMLTADGASVRSEMVKGQRGNWGRYLPYWPLYVAADPVGVDSYAIRTTGAMNIATQLQAKPSGKKYPLATVQDHHAIDELGLNETVRRSGDLIRESTLAKYEEGADFAHGVGAHVPDVKLWSELTHGNDEQGRKAGQSAWGMAIDLNKCIGCNACSIACQAENNVPVVGKDQVARGREMHWLRIDRYFTGRHVEDADGNPVTEPMTGNPKIDFSNPRVAHQPLTCQHCETAPCEQVCPVAATVHSHEGLNDMVYNRCIGTRYCANNCPFKVRRFNFFHYTDRFDDANNELMRLVMNPEVTVRSRGVMEKCTFCTQRISKARIEAKVEGREVRDGDVVTACQAACSTDAIAFGDLNDSTSKVAKWHKNERAYALLDGLRLKPRTKYLGRVLNPHKLLEPFLALPTVFNEHHEHDDHDGEHEGDHDHEHPEGEAHASHQAPSRNRLGDLPIIA